MNDQILDFLFEKDGIREDDIRFYEVENGKLNVLVGDPFEEDWEWKTYDCIEG